MARFTVRVELHKVSDYGPLHTAMANRGFTRTIKNDSTKVEYELPTGEYNYIDASGTDSTKNAILKLAKEAVKEAVKNETTTVKNANAEPMVLVTQSTARDWSGLPKV